MAKKLTVLQFQNRLEVLSRGLGRAVIPPFRKDLKLMQRALIAEYWENPFGARIWNWANEQFGWATSGRSGGSVFTGGKSGPAVKVGKGRSPVKWSASESAWLGRLDVRGLAAKLDKGGRLRKHAFWSKDRYRRPGVAVPRNPIFDEMIEHRLWDQTVDDVSKSFWRYVERTL